ncbi:MAG: GNAT family N-acetyltransferase [Burkholderiales bacterium]|nr:GNAT family N-acetyltransferase [Flavobacterium sp.]
MNIEDFIVDPLQSTDANQLFQFMENNNKRLQRYFPVTLSSNATLEKTTEYIVIKNKEIVEKSNFTFVIRDKISQEIAGLIIIKKIDWDKKQGELAYCIGSRYEKKGVTTFAVSKISQFAFNKLKLKTLQIISYKTNFGSIKVAENNGFVWQTTLVNEFTPTNEKPLDMELYELIMK